MGGDGPGRRRRLLFGILSLTLVAAVRCQPEGFLNIDCGKHEGFSASDDKTKLVYTSDHQYVSTGNISRVAAEYLDKAGDNPRYHDLRSFPNGIRNCYTLPVKPRQKYLARALFLYGNYDGLNRLPEFELFIGVNHWKTIAFTNTLNGTVFSDVLFVAGAAKASMDFCLVNTGRGTPFISALELRLLPNDLYPQVNQLQSLIMAMRFDDGATTELRYPHDPRDRIWVPYNDGYATLQTGKNVTTEPTYQPPLGVLQTAVYHDVVSNQTFKHNIRVDTALVHQQVHIFLYFAELQQLQLNESRAFEIFLNNQRITSKPVSPSYLQATVEYTSQPQQFNPLTLELQPTMDSTLPPILNAEEVYIAGNMTGAQTDQKDVDAINIVKAVYKVQRNWNGDPCSPNSYTWEGLDCSYDGSEITTLRIVSVNLSSSGLTGEISTALGNLFQLQSLDLSGNNLTGEIPAVFTNLINLKYLDLTGNTLDGPVPKSLLDRAHDGLLNLKLGKSTSYNATNKSKGKVIVVVGASIGIIVVLGTILLAVAIRRKMRKEPVGRQKLRNKTNSEVLEEHPSNSFYSASLRTQNKQFTYNDLVRITNNFNNKIGRGGFGSVYHGILDGDVKVEVAVKLLSKVSSQGTKEFQNEAVLLTRIHHRHLVSLIGFSKDNSNNLALVYEYMVHGSLHDHLQGYARKLNGPLNWIIRLRIATGVAQGLEYLHNGCKPPIIHRDVKTNNILLDQNFEAKIADFGLSKIFEDEDHSHVSTRVVGTPGYVDPEYYTSNKLTEKSDVYSFGIVLLELLTGLPPILTGNKSGSLVQWVRERSEHGDIAEIVDDNLQGNYSINSTWKVLEIALSCTELISSQRPNMSEVMNLLKNCLESDISKVKSQTTTSNVTMINSNTTNEIVTSEMTLITAR